MIDANADLPSDAKWKALHEAMARIEADPLKHAALKASLTEAVEELRRGESSPLDFDEIKRKGRELAAARRCGPSVNQ